MYRAKNKNLKIDVSNQMLGTQMIFNNEIYESHNSLQT